MSDRTTNYIDKLSNADNVDNVLWLFGAPLQNLADSVVDAIIRDNVEWQGKAGIPATVTRTAVGRTCEWCQEVAGSYTYPDVPADVWRRHERCNCIIKYTPRGGGRVDTLRGRQTAGDKAWYLEDSQILTARQNYTGVAVNTTPKQIPDIVANAEAAGIARKPVEDLPAKITEDEIIQRLGGSDQTRGSCSSLCHAYAANQNGLDVLDFRGGQSQIFFSRDRNAIAAYKEAGASVFTASNTNDYKAVRELMGNHMEPGKQYILGTGRHVGVIKTEKDGTTWYLELQSSTPGWEPFEGDKTLRWRWGCQKTHTTIGIKIPVESYLVPVDSIKPTDGYRQVLEFINTTEAEQNKGLGGGIK